MNVAFVIQGLERGGAERQLVNLAIGLHERGDRVVVAVFRGGGALQPELEAAGISVVDLRKRSRYSVLGPLVRLARLARAERVEVVHGYLVVANLLVTLLRLLRPGVRVVWGVRHSGLDLRQFDALTAASERVGPVLARRAHLVIANSEAGRDYHILRGYPASRIVVVPNGIDTQRFRPDRAHRDAVLRQWGIPPGATIVGMVARVDPTKDHETFVRAVARIGLRRPDVHAVVIGAATSWQRDALRTVAAEEGFADRFHHLGLHDDMAAAYNLLDLLCLASRTEGFPNVLAEAMACGVPCVTTDVGDARVIVGPWGAVAAPGDGPALADALDGMLARVEREPDLPERVRRSVEERYSLSIMVERSSQELLRLLADGSRSDTPDRGAP